MKTGYKIAIGTLLLGGFLFIRRQVKLLYGISYKIKKIAVGSITVDKLELIFDLDVLNKSSIGLDVTGYSFDVFINDLLVAKVVNKDIRHLNPKSSAIVSMKIVTSPKKVFKLENINTLLSVLKPDTMKIKLQGIISAQAGILNITNIPIDYENSLANMLKPKEEAV